VFNFGWAYLKYVIQANNGIVNEALILIIIIKKKYICRSAHKLKLYYLFI